MYAFHDREVTIDFSRRSEFRKCIRIDASRVQNLETKRGNLTKDICKRREQHLAYPYERMLRALVLHCDRELHHETARSRQAQQLNEKRVCNRITLIVRIKADTAHAMLFDTPAKILLPVG